MRKKRTPERMCVGCMERKQKRDMARIVRSPDNQVDVDLTGKKSGRGAYICYNSQCLEKAQKNRALERALRTKIDSELWDEIKSVLENDNKERDIMKEVD
ncbi:MAG: YlxR family protein [Clostridia bacterium]|nr:YlxR family protein [Clostridia bacterium]